MIRSKLQKPKPKDQAVITPATIRDSSDATVVAPCGLTPHSSRCGCEEEVSEILYARNVGSKAEHKTGHANAK